jgi:hypothetical protein
VFDDKLPTRKLRLIENVNNLNETPQLLSLILRWMPPCLHPERAGNYDAFTVHIQSGYSSAPGGCDTINLRSVIAPNKVERPTLGPWIEERNFRFGERINGMGSLMLMFVAMTARQPQIVQRGFTTKRFRQ